MEWNGGLRIEKSDERSDGSGARSAERWEREERLSGAKGVNDRIRKKKRNNPNQLFLNLSYF
jgi:hypothetical protein